MLYAIAHHLELESYPYLGVSKYDSSHLPFVFIMSNPQRPSNMSILVFASIAAIFVLFVIGAIINHTAKEFQRNSEGISQVIDSLTKKTIT